MSTEVRLTGIFVIVVAVESIPLLGGITELLHILSTFIVRFGEIK
jgi:hypothetical protein